ncbi:MAG: Gfo/Idh/MocA family oxidoreductase [Saprospiraceae bacterium]|nr:Gfo/Idh/MocA family oxidoreductase [Saprospiraceae bacterium]
MTTTRRNFIKNATVLSSVAAFSPHSFLAATQPLKEKLGIALVGLGYYSTDLLAPALQLTSHCELRGIVTGSPEKAAKWQQKYGIKDKNVYNYDNFDQIANNPDIDIVYVVLPPSMHREFTVRAAQAGKHVFCEKPMAPSVADCEAMIKACADHKVHLAIGYRCQHDPNIQAYMKVGKEKPFGKIKMVTSAAGYFDGRTTHWKQNKALGGGVMGDMGVYALQGARLATGEEPIAVTAQASTTRPEIYKEVEETMMFQLEFPSGALAACHTSYGINMNYLQVNYEKGWLKMEPHSAYSGNNGSLSDGTIINFENKNQQAKQMDEDAFAILNKKPLLVTGEEGLRDIRIVEAIYKAAKSGGRVKI